MRPAIKLDPPPATPDMASPTPSPRTSAPASPQAPGLAAAARSRPSWSGLLRFSLVAFPVKAYPAVASTNASHFHLLHADCGQRIQYQKHCPQHGPVEAQAIVRGFPHTPDHCVVVEPEELEQLRPAKDKALLLQQFLPLEALDPTWFAGRCLYLWPDGQAAQHPYRILLAALVQTGKGALAQVVFSNQRQLVLVRPRGRLLAMDVLHYPTQVRDGSSWETELFADASTETSGEIDLARQLIALASTPLDWARYRDTSSEDLRALVEAKVGRQPPPSTAQEPIILHLLDALQKSVAMAQGEADPATTVSTKAKTRQPRARRRTG